VAKRPGPSAPRSAKGDGKRPSEPKAAAEEAAKPAPKAGAKGARAAKAAAREALVDGPKAPPRDVPKVPPKDVPKVPPTDTPKVPPTDTPKVPPKDVPKEPPKEPPKDPRPTDGDGPAEFEFLVRGQVLYRHGLPLHDTEVVAFHRELRREIEVGRARTDDAGNYEIYYTADRLPGKTADLFTRAYDGKTVLGESRTKFSAGRIVKLRIQIEGGPEKTWSEYEQLMAEVEPLLDGLSLAELEETPERADVSVVAGKVAQPAERVATLVVAHKLAERTDLPAEIFYGLARQNVATNLSALLEAGPEIRREALETAVRRRIIPGRLADQVDAVDERVRRAIVGLGGTARSPLGAVLATALPKADDRTRFLDLYVDHKGTREEFWDAVGKDGTLGAKRGDLQLTLQLAALTDGHAPLMSALRKRRGRKAFGTFRQLAKLDAAGWEEIIRGSSTSEDELVPADVPGRTTDERVQLYAATLERIVGDTLPTEVLAYHAASAEESPADVKTFWQNVTKTIDADGLALELGSLEIGSLLTEHRELLSGVKDADALVSHLGAVQRVFNLTTAPTEIDRMLAADITSSSDVTRLGQDVFVQRFAEDLGADRAALIYDKAEAVTATTMTVATQYGPQFNQVPMLVLPTPDAARIPQLATLFGSLDMCECEHCRSVSGPAAYFAETLAYLADRRLQPPPPSGETKALDVLFQRRPDLGELELTCENTNTVLPYVDLVNEVLERAVEPFQPFQIASTHAAELDARTVSPALRTAFATAGVPLTSGHFAVVVKPGSEWFVTDHSVLYTVRRNGSTGDVGVRSATYQTGAPADQLAANPEHAWEPAYRKLRDAVFPWSLPLDLWREEVVTYLGHLGVERHELMADLAQGGLWPALRNVPIGTEYLGLNDRERQAITGALGGFQPWQFYGLAQTGNATDVFEPATPASLVTRSLEWRAALSWVRVMLARASVSYDELLTLLTTEFVNPGGTVRIVSADPADLVTCEIDKLKLTGVDAPFLARLHRFVVLWRRLGWTAHELDLAIGVLQAEVADVNQRLSDAFLLELSHVERLRRRLGLPVDELLTFWGPISTRDSEPGAEDSLYLRLFQNPSVLNPVDPGFALRSGEPAVTATPAQARISLNTATLLAAFGVTAAELAKLAAVVTPTDALNRASLSALYRHVLLARGLGLPVEDFLALVAMSGIDPFSPATRDAVYLVELADRVAASGLSIAETDYVLNHGSADRVDWDPLEETVATFLDGLRVALRRVREDTTLRPDPVGDVTRATLASLRWPGEVVDEVIATLAGTVTYREPLAALPPGIVIPPALTERVTFDDAANELVVIGPLTASQRVALRDASTDAAWRTAVDAAFARPRDVVEDRMRAYEHPTYYADLAALPAGVAFPAGLRRRVFYDASTRKLGFAGVMTGSERTALDELSGNAAYRTAVQQLHAAPAAFVPDAANVLFAAGAADALFDSDTITAADRFAIVLERLLGYLRKAGSERAVAEHVSGALALSGAAAHRLLTTILHADAAPPSPAMADFLDEAFAGSDPSVVLTATAFPRQFRTYVRLAKAVRLADALELPPAQLEWLGRFGAGVAAREVPWRPGSGVTAGWLRLDDLPAAPVAASAQRLAALLRVADLVQVRDAVKGGFATVSAILELARTPGSLPDPRGRILTAIAERTGWPRADLDALTVPAVLGLAFPADLADENGLVRLHRAVRRVLRLGASPQQCRGFAQTQVGPEDAKAARQLAKAKYSNAAWREVARPLRDTLRERQRRALVDYLVARPEPARGRTWRDANGLYSHFLIDPEMSACAMTSRLKQAIGSVQQFVQRCLLNLEPKVDADAGADAGWRDWRWMKSYRVWEANRKVFMYPENWLEPELRDDKSPFFDEAQSALLQSDVTAEVAEDVFMTYLERLDSVARLEIAGVYHQAASDGQPEVLHVFGRTFGATTPAHWYRRRIGKRWTAWERVDLDISEPQLLPIVWNRRLYLFWPVFTEGSTPRYGEGPTPPARHFDLQLAWSEYKRGKWQPKRVTTRSVRSRVTPDDSADRGRSQHYLRAGIDGQGLKVWYEYDDPSTVVPIPGPYGTTVQWVNGAVVDGWNFTGCEGKVEPYERIIQGVFQPAGTTVDGMTFAEWGSSPLSLPKVLSSGEHVALANTPGRFSLAYLHQDGHITGLRPFFYADDARTYLVESVQESETLYGLSRASTADLSSLDEVRRQYYVPILLRDPEVIDPVGPVTRFGVSDPVPIATNVIERTKRYTKQHRHVGASGGGTAPTLLAEHHSATLDLATTKTPFAGEKAERTLSYAVDHHERIVVAKGDQAVYSIPQYIDTARIEDAVWLAPVSNRAVRRYEFKNFFHPHVCPFMKQLDAKGVDGLMARSTQLVNQKTFRTRYAPTDVVVKGNPTTFDRYPAEDVDFSHGGAYSVYNWELFFHLPLLIATRLMQSQRFEEAQRWLHFIFDPTDTTEATAPQRYWRTKPFFEQSQQDVLEQRIDRLITQLVEGEGDPELEAQVGEWRRNPFKPHAIARLRIAAYQKNVVMRYLDNLVAWGDQLFRRDTIESINEATQLYVLAAEILGPRPSITAARAEPQVQTFNSLDPEVEQLSDELVDIEYLFGALRPDSVVSTPGSPPLPLPRMLFFCVPPNDKLLGYWDTVADRLFKIRNCMNIEGVVRQLPLFEPPIDPALLVRAAAAGVDISAALSDAAAPLPIYRFRPLSGKARELTSAVRSLGSALHAALESRDSEQLALLRAGNEIAVQETAEQVRLEQLEEAEHHIEALRRSRAVAVTRYLHYQRLLGVQSPRAPAEGEAIPDATASASFSITSEDGAKLIQQEDNELAKLREAHAAEGTASDWDFAASLAHIVPNFNVDLKPWGIGAGMSFGGSNVGSALGAVANRYRSDASNATFDATRAARIGGYVLREQDWVLQSNLAAKEIMHVDAEIVGAEIRRSAADRELASHRKRMELSAAELEFMTGRFTNAELHVWMIGKLSEVYFQTYRLAYDVAKRAERAYRHELGVADSDFIQFGYWNSLQKGLLAGEQLELDLHRMEVSYLDLNRREHELTKHVSLNLLHPEALVDLRETGSCFVELPEAIFDLDHPGHYMRRLRSVSLTIPCTTGPYTTVSCKVTQLGNRLRRDTRLTPQYRWQGLDDPRFAHDAGGVESIVTSSAREDSGLFQLDFGDDRYLPFEGRGAVSAWRLELPETFRQFDYDTISDVVFHVRYTARDGGGSLRTAAATDLTTSLKTMEVEPGESGLFRLFMARTDYPDAFHRLLHPAPGAAQQAMAFPLDRARFPAYLHGRTIKVTSLAVFLRLAGGVEYDADDPLVVTVRGPGGAPSVDVPLQSAPPELGGLPGGVAAFSGPGVALSATQPWQVVLKEIPAALGEDVDVDGSPVRRLKAEVAADLGILCTYTF
jgi:hypothetical protein